MSMHSAHAHSTRIRPKNAATAVSAALVALAVAGCAAERAPRSFVQPNAIKKADMAGSWYYVQTVLDSPPTNAAAFVGLSSDLMKIKFDIQENTLYARRAFEQIKDSEDAKLRDPKGYQGQPLAAWNIQKHFDVIRDYNPTTGEETNRIIESEERPWSEREFIRVDWSKNVITDYSGIGLHFWFYDSKIEPVSFWESDPASPDAIHFERATKDEDEFKVGEMNYFDLVNKLLITPTEYQFCFDQGGVQSCMKVPACFLRQQLDDCAAAVVKVRHGFAKISPTHKYEPRKWDGKQMELFGLWDVSLNRLSYNRQYGITNPGIQRHAARFNLWKKSYDANKNPIPYPKRELRTIPYYAGSSTGTFPPELFAEGKKVVDQWNDAVGVAVKNVMGTMPDKRIFEWCHNPVKLAADAQGPADPEACKGNLKPELDAKGKIRKDEKGNPILLARQGDPRRSTIFWVNQFQAAGPLGYGPPLYDVETGETISGQSYIYGGVLDILAARARDLVLLVSGKLAPDKFIEGTNVSEWVNSNRTGVANLPATYSQSEVAARAGAMDFKWAEGLAHESKLDLSSLKNFADSFRARQGAIAKTGVFGRGQGDLGQLRRDRLRGSQIEAMLVPPELLRGAAGARAGAWSSLSDADKLRASPLRRDVLTKALRERSERLMSVGVDFADFADEGIAQRAMQLARDPATQSLDPDAVRQKIRRDVFLALSLHEMGHNVGLRHNFRASYDSLNYLPQYWDLRAKGAQSTRKYAGLDARTLRPTGAPYQGADCAAGRGRLRPRYVDCAGGALSVEEAEGGISEFQYSSVMDYGSEFNSDLYGLGLYDKAAMKFAYSGDGYVEVFTRAKADAASQDKLASLQFFSTYYGFPSPITVTQSRNGADVLQGMAYVTYPDLFQGGWPDIHERQDVPFADVLKASQGSPILVDDKDRVMVPYFFCGDEFIGNLTCQPWDSGADAYEQASDLISRYHNHYVLNNFKRDRYTFRTSSAYLNRIAQRYLDPLRSQALWYTLFKAIFAGSEDTLFHERGWGNFPVAVTEGFDLLGRIITQPEPGTYVKLNSTQAFLPLEYWAQASERTDGQSNDQRTVVGLIDGKYSYTTWDFGGCGYYWADECETRIGYLWDKLVALQVLTDSQAYFTGRDTSPDLRFYSIGYYIPFKKQLEEKFGAIFSYDYRSLAPYADASGRRLVNPSWTLNDPAAAKARILDPAVGFTVQLYAALFGMSGFPATFDQSFIETSRVFAVGNGEAPVPDVALMPTPGTPGPDATFDPAALLSATPPGTKSWLLWTDKTTGKTYASRTRQRTAHDIATRPYRTDIGSRMLETAITMEKITRDACLDAAGSANCVSRTRTFDFFRENLEIMRLLHKILGN